jgi:integrase
MGGDRGYRLVRHRGRFSVAWHDGATRRRHALGTADRDLAEARLAEYVRVKRLAAQGGPATVASIYDSYALDREREAISAAPRIRDAWKRLAPTFGALLPGHVNKELCRAYIQRRRAAGASNGTIHVELGYLRTALRYARKQGWLLYEPHVDLPSKPPPRDHSLTKDEARRLIAAANAQHIRLFIRLALATAARAGALLDLTWDRVDLERRQIDLREPARLATPKGRARVPINDMALHALREARHGALSAHVIEWAGARVKSVKKGVAAAARGRNCDAARMCCGTPLPCGSLKLAPQWKK